jgi:hypothetical protein
MKPRDALRAPLLALALGATPAAQAEIVIIAAANATVAPSIEQVCQVYLGKLKTPTPISLLEQHPVRDEFYLKACKKDPAQVRAMWGKLIFTGTGTPPREVPSPAEMKKAVAATPGSVGYIDRKDLDATVKVIAAAN